MSTSDIRPKWWQLYLIFPLLISLLMIDANLQISIRGHGLVQIGIILLIYGLMYMWVNGNAAALSRLDRNEYRGRIIVVHFSALTNKETNPMFELSDSETKDLMSYIKDCQSGFPDEPRVLNDLR
jgi:hypothetical protein